MTPQFMNFIYRFSFVSFCIRHRNTHTHTRYTHDTHTNKRTKCVTTVNHNIQRTIYSVYVSHSFLVILIDIFLTIFFVFFFRFFHFILLFVQPCNLFYVCSGLNFSITVDFLHDSCQLAMNDSICTCGQK